MPAEPERGEVRENTSQLNQENPSLRHRLELSCHFLTGDKGEEVTWEAPPETQEAQPETQEAQQSSAPESQIQQWAV